MRYVLSYTEKVAVSTDGSVGCIGEDFTEEVTPDLALKEES